MKAVILAGGKGERLRPITSTRPKPLIPVLCKPLLFWQLDALNKIDNINEIIIVASYMKDKIKESIKSYSSRKPIRIIDQGKELGTGHAVSKALEKIDVDDEILIIYGDLFLGNWNVLKDLSKIDGNVIVGVEHSNPSEYGVLIVERNKVTNIIEKPSNPPTNLVNAGIYKFSSIKQLKNYTENIKPSERGEFEFTDAIANMAKDGIDIGVYTINEDEWIDIGLPWNVLEANKLALNKYLVHEINGVIESGVEIKGKVHVGKNTIIRSHSYIIGPVYIDEEVDIGPCTFIRPYSVICRGSRIGFSVEVKASIIMEHVHISHLSYVGDSIICENVNFGAGTITANLRFDNKPVKMMVKDRIVSTGRRKFGAVVGANVKTGVNVSLMPGVKIGINSWIAPGSVVYRDVPDNTFFKPIEKHELKDIKP